MSKRAKETENKKGGKEKMTKNGGHLEGKNYFCRMKEAGERRYSSLEKTEKGNRKIMETEALVSIIIPTFSRPQNLVRAVESCLKQTYGPIEVIVVDDNGEGTPYQQETEQILKEYVSNGTVVYLKHDVNRRGGAARNTGLKVFKGAYYTFLDDDDCLYPQKIEREVEQLQKQKDRDVVYCGYEKRCGEQSRRFVPTKEGDLHKDLLLRQWHFGSGSNPLFRREVFEDIGYFDETFVRHQDLEYMVRVLRKHRVAVVQDVLFTKYTDTQTNRPKAENYLPIKEQFLTKYREDIERYGKSVQSSIYRNHWYELAQMGFGDRNYRVGWQCLRKACGYRCLTAKQILKLVYQTVRFKEYGR